MSCCICNRGLAEGVSLYRVNEKGVPGVWACEVHIVRFPFKKPDPIVAEIVAVIEADGKKKH
jgi:hypothetical protein